MRSSGSKVLASQNASGQSLMTGNSGRHVLSDNLYQPRTGKGILGITYLMIRTLYPGFRFSSWPSVIWLKNISGPDFKVTSVHGDVLSADDQDIERAEKFKDPTLGDNHFTSL